LRIAIASGKGGTGKTTLAVSLALALAETHPVELVDCDVEEPNDHIFLSPTIRERKPVEVLVPEVEREACLGCGACAKACRYGALVVIGRQVFFHYELCHSCGLCRMICPTQAIREVPRTIGWIERGEGKGLPFLQGVLNVGEPRATPVIRALKEMTDPKRITILDSPPGTGCPMVETVKGADYVILVTEPTPFGLHDLQAALAVTEALGVPAGVVVSKWGVGTDHVERFCAEKGLPMLLRIPWDQAIARAYANGIPLVEALPEWREPLRQLFHDILLARGGSGNG
jgi:MinD superfamily P-loop ATPase